MKEHWTKEQACEWYARQGWLRGCNFIGSDCANRLDMFQAYKADEKLATAEEEVAFQLSDIISFHSYQAYHKLVAETKVAKNTVYLGDSALILPIEY